MKFRRFSAFFLAQLLAVLCVLPAGAVAEGCTQETNVTTILFTHDLHSHFLPQPTAAGGESGGYARLKTAYPWLPWPSTAPKTPPLPSSPPLCWWTAATFPSAP